MTLPCIPATRIESKEMTPRLNGGTARRVAAERQNSPDKTREILIRVDRNHLFSNAFLPRARFTRLLADFVQFFME